MVRSKERQPNNSNDMVTFAERYEYLRRVRNKYAINPGNIRINPEGGVWISPDLLSAMEEADEDIKAQRQADQRDERSRMGCESERALHIALHKSGRPPTELPARPTQ